MRGGHIRNESGQSLTVYAKYPGTERVYQWQLQPGKDSYLAIENQRRTASELYLWARSD